MSKQTHTQSIIESCTQTVVAFLLSILIQPVILGHWHLIVSYTASMQIAIAFTTVSFIRSYIVRRFFNHIHHRGSK
jgi:hypothetical protein